MESVKEYDVIGIGSALMDFLVRVDSEFLKELGLEKGTMSLVGKDESKKIIEKISNFETAAGGSSANTIAGIAMLGGKAVFCGKVGQDSYGELYSKKTAGEGAEPEISTDNEETTGNAITLITPDNERTFATHLGAATKLRKADIPEEKIAKSKILHIEGYQLEDPELKAASVHAMEIAKQNSSMVSIDLADPSFVSRNLESLKKIVSNYADIVFANEEEAKAFTGKENPEDALKEIGSSCKIAIVKTGETGSLAMENSVIHKIPAFKTSAVDTTGAGDIYASGVLWGISNNIPLIKACELGSRLASRVVSKIGARLGKEETVQIKESFN